MFGFGKHKERDARKELYGSVVSFVLEALRAQIGEMDGVTMTPAGPALPKVAMDDFSLGYVAGFVEALSAFRQLDAEEAGHGLYLIIFTELFGLKTGPLLFAHFIKEQGAGSDVVRFGIDRGNRDLFLWLNGEIESPKEWAGYVNKN